MDRNESSFAHGSAAPNALPRFRRPKLLSAYGCRKLKKKNCARWIPPATVERLYCSVKPHAVGPLFEPFSMFWILHQVCALINVPGGVPYTGMRLHNCA